MSAALLTIRNATLFTNHRRMRAVFHHSGVWSKIWNIRGHRDCHTAICICITFDASCIRPIARNVTRATSLAFERGSCVKKYTTSSNAIALGYSYSNSFWNFQDNNKALINFKWIKVAPRPDRGRVGATPSKSYVGDGWSCFYLESGNVF